MNMFGAAAKSNSTPAVDATDVDDPASNVHVLDPCDRMLIVDMATTRSKTTSLQRASVTFAKPSSSTTDCDYSTMTSSELTVITQPLQQMMMGGGKQSNAGEKKSSTLVTKSDCADPRKELDIVLQELLNNIGDLSLQLTGWQRFHR